MLGHEIQGLEMDKAWSTDLTPVGLVSTIGHQVDTKLPLWSFNAYIHLSCRHYHPFGVMFEMVDQGLHGGFHVGPRRRSDLTVIHLDASFWHGVDAGKDDPQGLTHLLNPDHVPVVAIPVGSYRHVKGHSVIGVSGLGLSKVPGHPRSTKHHPREAPSKGVFRRHGPNVYQTLLPDPVVGEHLFHLINPRRKVDAKGVNVVTQAKRKVLSHSTWTNVGRMHSGTGHALVELHQFFPLLKGP